MVEGVDFLFSCFTNLFALMVSNVIFSSFVFVAILGWIIAFFLSLRNK